jgi:hypothetical protein
MIANAPHLPVITPASTNPAIEVARTLTGRDYVSWSALSTFRTCPLKYKFRYVDGLPEEGVSSALVFGTGIHTAIELPPNAVPVFKLGIHSLTLPPTWYQPSC